MLEFLLGLGASILTLIILVGTFIIVAACMYYYFKPFDGPYDIANKHNWKGDE